MRTMLLRLLPALSLAAGPVWATRRNETDAAALGSGHDDNSNSNNNNNGSSTAALGPENGDGEAAPIMVPINYTFTVFNSDCPCQRAHLRYCTWFRRRRLLDGRCYNVSHSAHSARVWDPLVSERSRLECRVHAGLGCAGAGAEMAFVDGTRCVEPAPLVDGQSPPAYRSFVCDHVAG